MKYAIILAVVLSVGCSGRNAEQANARGKACYERAAYPCAVKEFSAAVHADPSSARFHYNLALALGRTGLHDQAVAELEEVLRLDATHADARRTLAAVQQMLRNRQAAMVADQLRSY